MSKIELFISHSSVDKGLVEDFAKLIANCFNVSDEVIRCSSAERFKYSFGTKILSEIRDDIQDAVVVAFVTKNTRQSEWVLLELGIAMTVAKKTIVTILTDSDKDEIPKFLQGDSLHATISQRDALDRFIYDLESLTNWKKRPPKTVSDEIEAFLHKIQGRIDRFPIHQLLKRKNIYEERNNLKWPQIAEYIQSDLTIIGWACRNVFNSATRVHFVKMLEAGVKMNIIIQSPEAISESPLLNFGPVCDHTKFPERIVKDIKTGIEQFNEFFETLSDKARENINLIETNWLITWSAVAIDIESGNGVVQLEIYHYDNPTGNHLDDRPNLVLTPKSELYEGFKNSIINIKNSGKKLNLKK
jgi:hypothetical protein